MKSRRGHTKCKLHCSMTASVLCAGNGCLQGNQCANHQNTTAKHNKKKIDRLRSRPSVEPQRLHTYSQYDVYVRKQNTSNNRFPLAKQTVRQPINRIYRSASVLLRLLHIERDISTCRLLRLSSNQGTLIAKSIPAGKCVKPTQRKATRKMQKLQARQIPGSKAQAAAMRLIVLRSTMGK